MHNRGTLLVEQLCNTHITDQNVNGEVFMDSLTFMATVNWLTVVAVTASVILIPKRLPSHGLTVLIKTKQVDRQYLFKFQVKGSNFNILVSGADDGLDSAQKVWKAAVVADAQDKATRSDVTEE